MRKRILAAVVLVGVGFVLLWHGRAEVPEGASAASNEPSGARRLASEARAGTRLQPVNAEDEDARGPSGEDSIPELEQSPSEAEGVLEVEVLAGTQPVPGASVRLYWRGPRDPDLDEVSWRPAGERSTDERGGARLAARPGGYLVAVRAPGHAPLVRDVVRPYGEPRTYVRLTVEPGQVLAGRTVVLGTQEPLPLVELVLTAHGRKLEPWQTPEAPEEERAYASSGARGDFRFERLAPGSYQLEARAPGHASSRSTVQVPAQEPLTVALQAASFIEGFVVDAQGSPATGAEVQVSGNTPQTVTTGQGGGFSLEVAPGTHTLSARRGTEAGSLDRPLVVGLGRTVRDVRLRLGPGAGVEGRVYAKATGAPVAGARVEVSRHGLDGDSGRGVTDDTGHFSVEGLAAGSYDVKVSAPGFSSLTREGLTVSVGGRFPVELALVGTGGVEGEVRDGAGQPLPGMPVVAGDSWSGELGSMPAEARTDAEGRYRLEGLSAGVMTVSVKREGALLGASLRVEIREGQPAQVNFTLENTGTVEGVVRAAQGSLPSEPLEVTTFAQGPVHSSAMDMVSEEVSPDGHFRMSLPPGTYHLMLSPRTRGSSSRRSFSAHVRVEPGKSTQVEFTWQEDPVTQQLIQGAVLEPDGTPSLRAAISYGPEHTRWSTPTAAFTDEQGRFSLAVASEAPSSVPPRKKGSAPVRMKLSAYNGGRTGAVLGVKPGEQDVVVRLEPGLPLRGRVVRAARSTPVKGFTLLLQYQGGQQALVLSGSTLEFAADRFELGDVPAAQVMLVVRTSDGAVGETLVTPGSEAMGEVVISVLDPAIVKGRVIDADTGAPLAEARVFAVSRPDLSAPSTLSDGVFKLDALPPGEHRLLIGARPPYIPESRTVTIVEGREIDLGDIAIRTFELPADWPPPPKP